MKKINLAFLRDPKFRYGSLSTALLCVAIAALIALSGLFTALEKTFDLVHCKLCLSASGSA